MSTVTWKTLDTKNNFTTQSGQTFWHSIRTGKCLQWPKIVALLFVLRDESTNFALYINKSSCVKIAEFAARTQSMILLLYHCVLLNFVIGESSLVEVSGCSVSRTLFCLHHFLGIKFYWKEPVVPTSFESLVLTTNQNNRWQLRRSNNIWTEWRKARSEGERGFLRNHRLRRRWRHWSGKTISGRRFDWRRRWLGWTTLAKEGSTSHLVTLKFQCFFFIVYP